MTVAIMTQKFRYSEKEMKIALKRSLNLCVRGLAALWQYSHHNQNYNSQEAFFTHFHTGDENFFLDVFECIQKRGWITRPQEKALQKRMPKYAGQLADVANLPDDIRLPKLQLPKAEQQRSDMDTKFWYILDLPKFDNRGTYVKAAACGDGLWESARLSFPLKSSEIYKTIEITNTPMGEGTVDVYWIGLPRWLCEKLKIDTDYTLSKPDHGKKIEINKS
jgi:hypothetical protein